MLSESRMQKFIGRGSQEVQATFCSGIVRKIRRFLICRVATGLISRSLNEKALFSFDQIIDPSASDEDL